MKQPNEVFDSGAILIKDDTECIRILTELGVLDKVRPFPPHNQASHAFDDEEFWALAVCHTGCLLPTDNGYCICLLPKITITKEQACLFFSDLLWECSESKRFEQREFAVTVKTNN